MHWKQNETLLNVELVWMPRAPEAGVQSGAIAAALAAVAAEDAARDEGTNATEQPTHGTSNTENPDASTEPTSQSTSEQKRASCSATPAPGNKKRDGASSSEYESDDGGALRPEKRPARIPTHTSFMRATSSDAWFLSNSHRRNFASRKLGRDLLRGTSNKKISDHLPPLDVAQLPALAHKANTDGPPALPARTAHSRSALALHLRAERLDMYTAQLLGGFHLMFYGVGDRLPVVRALVEQGAARHAGAAVLVQGAAGRALHVDRVLDAIEDALGMHQPGDVPFHAPPEPVHSRLARPVHRMRRVTQFLTHTARYACKTHPQHLFLGLLAFDSASFHTNRLEMLVHGLAQCEQVHLVASVSHVQAGLVLDGAAGAFGAGRAGVPPGPPDGHAPRATWLWHHVTTYIPPVAEMLYARGVANSTHVSGLAAMRLPAALDLGGGRARSAISTSAATAVAQPVSETAAIQVLSTITARARNLFAQLASLQLLAAAPDNEVPRTPYASLVRQALREFVASSDEGVRQLLGEMVDHGLVVVTRGSMTVSNSHAIAVGDELAIPLSVTALEEVLAQVA